MKIIVVPILGLFLSSCMHLVMMGSHGGEESTQHQSMSDSVLEKEVTVGDVKAIATFPPLQIGKQTTFTLKLEDKTTGKPISKAHVSFHTAYLHTGEVDEMGGMHMMHGEMDTSHAQSAPDHDVNFEQELVESSTPGIYSIAFTPSQAGEQKVMFHINAIGGQQLQEEIIVETKRNTSTSSESHGGGMMRGMGGTSEYAFIGVALMGTMMIVLWLTRGGHMF